MGTFVADRLIRFVVVVFGATLIAFVLLRLAGDPATVLLPVFATPEQRQELRKAYGLDQPLPVQFYDYVSHAVRGDFGESYSYRQPASTIVVDRLPVTLELVALSIGFAVVLGLLFGILASTRAGRPADAAVLTSVLAIRAVPQFWLGTLLILFFAVKLHWLPTSGIGGVAPLVMPVLTIALFFVAEFTIVVRAGMIEALAADYVRAATAKGLPRRLVVFRHALRNSLNPLLSVVAVNFGTLLGGTVIVENVFAVPGVGLLAVQAVGQSDYPILQATVLSLSIIIALVTTGVEVLYGVLDPRIRRAS